MATRDETLCDACSDEGRARAGHPVYLGFAKAWWQLDLCDEHQVTLVGGLEALLDSVGAPATGPALELALAPAPRRGGDAGATGH